MDFTFQQLKDTVMGYAKSSGFRAFMRQKSGRFIGGDLAVVLGSSVWANADVEKNITNSKNWAVQAGDMANYRYSLAMHMPIRIGVFTK